MDSSRPGAVFGLCRTGVVVLALVGAAIPVFSQAPVCSYAVVQEYPHDPDAFTQGLVYDGGELFESTGLYGESSLRRVELSSGAVLQMRQLDGQYFGEGLALWEDTLLQLTYQENTGFIWNSDTFAPMGTFAYTGEGWGLTHDGQQLIMSDGTSALRFLDPVTYAEVGSVAVTDGGSPIDRLNELEWIRGEVFANVWLTDLIARIDPDTGEILAWINLAGLLDPVPPGSDILNGIAWDDTGERLFVTGKFWPSLFEIELIDCPELRLFFDGFERGDTSGWSGSAP